MSKKARIPPVRSLAESFDDSRQEYGSLAGSTAVEATGQDQLELGSQVPEEEELSSALPQPLPPPPVVATKKAPPAKSASASPAKTAPVTGAKPIGSAPAKRTATELSDAAGKSTVPKLESSATTAALPKLKAETKGGAIKRSTLTEFSSSKYEGDEEAAATVGETRAATVAAAASSSLSTSGKKRPRDDFLGAASGTETGQLIKKEEEEKDEARSAAYFSSSSSMLPPPAKTAPAKTVSKPRESKSDLSRESIRKPTSAVTEVPKSVKIEGKEEKRMTHHPAIGGGGGGGGGSGAGAGPLALWKPPPGLPDWKELYLPEEAPFEVIQWGKPQFNKLATADHWTCPYRMLNAPSDLETPARLNLFFQGANFPMGIRANKTRTSYSCNIELPEGSLWEEIMKRPDDMWGSLIRTKFETEMKEKGVKLDGWDKTEKKVIKSAFWRVYREAGVSEEKKVPYKPSLKVAIDIDQHSLRPKLKYDPKNPGQFTNEPEFYILETDENGVSYKSSDPFAWRRCEDKRFSGDVIIELRYAQAIPNGKGYGLKFVVRKLRPRPRTKNPVPEMPSERRDDGTVVEDTYGSASTSSSSLHSRRALTHDADQRVPATGDVTVGHEEGEEDGSAHREVGNGDQTDFNEGGHDAGGEAVGAGADFALASSAALGTTDTVSEDAEPTDEP